MCRGISSKTCSPATDALERALKATVAPLVSKEPQPMISLKRPRSFDLSPLLEATHPVEDSIAFPSIEWSFDTDSDDEDESVSPAAKRRCTGLNRSSRVNTNLSTFGSSSRMESFGSLC